MTDGAAAAQAFYGRWAGLYDRIATLTPGVGGAREAAVNALALDPGDTVVEMGCGTGANLPLLRQQVGPAGRVVGVDFTRGMLDRATARADRWENVHLVQGDAVRPPVDGPVDAVLATFVVGMLPNPGATVESWLDLLGLDGRLALLDAARSNRWYARPLNAGFRGFVRASAPGGGAGYEESPTAVLDRRVTDARDALKRHAIDVEEDSHLLGFVYLALGKR
ncbi:class I SAM-dependent methyltransferase [Halobacteriaceae archaeon GCM10025711]